MNLKNITALYQDYNNNIFDIWNVNEALTAYLSCVSRSSNSGTSEGFVFDSSVRFGSLFTKFVPTFIRSLTFN